MTKPEDNWHHRSERMRCASCIWYVAKGEGILGRCRKRAPELGGFPVRYQSDWCGDHKLSEHFTGEQITPEMLMKAEEEMA